MSPPFSASVRPANAMRENFYSREGANMSTIRWREINFTPLHMRVWSTSFLAVCVLSLIFLVITPAQAQALSSSGSSFFDRLGPNDALFYASDGYGNGSPFINAWKSDHVTFAHHHMELTLDNQANYGYQYTSGEYRTHGFYGYGVYAVRMKPNNQHGVISSFF